jgi:hypothetical protein
LSVACPCHTLSRSSSKNLWTLPQRRSRPRVTRHRWHHRWHHRWPSANGDFVMHHMPFYNRVVFVPHTFKKLQDTFARVWPGVADTVTGQLPKAARSRPATIPICSLPHRVNAICVELRCQAIGAMQLPSAARDEPIAAAAARLMRVKQMRGINCMRLHEAPIRNYGLHPRLFQGTALGQTCAASITRAAAFASYRHPWPSCGAQLPMR